MVKREVKNNEEYFLCEECKLCYKDENTAKKCENFCTKNHACSIEITKHAVKLK